MLLKNIRDAKAALVALASDVGPAENAAKQTDANVEQFLAHLRQVWRQGEVRPTHKQPPKTPRTWRTRTNRFEGVWPELEKLLTPNPT
ncbi:MAG: hypothetical protein IPK13_15970 [Deltaproteobacteria bacterium]|nr:hypothetical protein [Deltaproteobacteria bacterium]